MKILIIILIAASAFCQDFGMMLNHLDGVENPKTQYTGFTEAVDTTTYSWVSSGEGWIKYSTDPIDLWALKKQYKEIYREEYLRMIAKKFLAKEFPKLIDSLQISIRKPK